VNEELRELVALRALHALDPADAARLDEALARDPELAAQLAADAALVAALGRELPRVALPADLAERALAAAGGAPAAARPARARRPRRRLLAGLVAAAAAAAAVGAWDASRGGPTPDARAALASARATGSAELYGQERRGGTLRLRLRGLAAAPAGHHYQVWVLPAGRQVMASVARVAPRGGAVDVRLPLPAAGSYAAIDVSLERDGAAPGPTGPNGPSVVIATFSSRRAS
jgi:hypothetical protein